MHSHRKKFQQCLSSLLLLYIISTIGLANAEPLDIETVLADIKANKNAELHTENAYDFFKRLFSSNPLSTNTVRQYNDIGYYLNQHGYHSAAETILSTIARHYPNRTVVHLNLAETYAALRDLRGSNHYNETYYQRFVDQEELTYLALLLHGQKLQRAPSNLIKRHQHLISLLKQIQKHLKNDPYRIHYLTQGDLNQDNISDIALVTELAESDKVENHDSEWFMRRPENKNTRNIFIFLGTQNQDFQLLVHNKKFIEPDIGGSCNDPFDALRIKKNNLFIDFGYWCSAGSWSQGGDTYQFIFRDKHLRLAGQEYWTSHRASAEGLTISTNYLTGKVIRQKTVDHRDPIGTPKISKIEINPIYLQDFDPTTLQE